MSYCDFHVLQGIAPGGGTGMEACPSNYYNCKCWKNGDRAGRVADINGRGIADIAGRDYFRIDKGLCGMGQLDFYKRPSGIWEFYVNKGNGELQGRCYENSADSRLCMEKFKTALDMSYSLVIFRDSVYCRGGLSYQKEDNYVYPSKMPGLHELFI
ncbi:hypothetical protein K501DRAFT_268744 [Backusella circina FSU 941]|nr:hypothetical protein K501DRAFT_268744 [Backusella circina FSU 941]